MTTTPTITCSSSYEETLRSVSEATGKGSLREQQETIDNWFQKLRSMTGENIRQQGTSYEPNALGRLTPEPVSRTLTGNREILARELSKRCGRE